MFFSARLSLNYKINNMRIKYLLVIAATFIIFLCTSCGPTTNKITYFQNAQDTTYKMQDLKYIESPLQKNDFISIAISSLDQDASAMFNPMASESDKNAGADKQRSPSKSKGTQFIGYLIDNDGNIELPYLGKIMAAGLTKKQLKEHITSLILTQKLLKDPIVDIRFLNFEVTILGEVTTPSVISVPDEKISLVKALAMVGDLTIYGKRENILLIREEGGVRKTRHINLNSSDFLNSEFYYLKPNDVVYVEPNKIKAEVATTSPRKQQWLPIIVTTASSLVFIVLAKYLK